jgi:hypothetical protein
MPLVTGLKCKTRGYVYYTKYISMNFTLVRRLQIKSSLAAGLDTPLGFLQVEAPEFLDNLHMKVVRLSALRTGRLYSQERFLVLISVRGSVDPNTTMRPEGLSHGKIPVTPSGI